ncbi:LytTR family DNA-binding domain-containing protein [Pseudoduganella ginsengisoli]|uniref:Response regulator n=1 Tax=Pseudoduganella ginsengisoli TaxID=1462440 RepID=A0A6L6Q8S7_9BURK|nr:LytTR family DNA-binding domain-containing protein [Pseudoduganella ginsengisoli]MTW05622.1 response regulator [Pseudoduganella ginsengisoli]
MKVAIIDDEPLARDELRRMLRVHTGVQIVAEAASVAEGLQVIARAMPDLIFLDIQMPDGSGFDLLSALDVAPAVIFTTAYDRFAIRAFDVNALDYLLKPIEDDRLAQALHKAERGVAAVAGGAGAGSAPADAPALKTALHPAPDQKPVQIQGGEPEQGVQPAAPDGKVFIQDGERCWFVELERIMLFESEGNYTRVYFDQHRPLMLRSLVQLEARLDPAHFVRTSRSQIVNMRFVAEMTPSPAGGLTLVLQNGMRVAMSRRRSTAFKQGYKL